MTTPSKLSQHDINIKTATAALQRADALARKIAMDTDTCLVVRRNGKTLHISAEQLRQQVHEDSKGISDDIFYSGQSA